MKTIALVPQPCTPRLLDELEGEGLLVRLAPGRHAVKADPGKAIGTPVYPPSEGRGGHLLLACTINQVGFGRFGWHDAAEEFWLIGPDRAGPLFLAFFRGFAGTLQAKIDEGEIGAADFVCFRCHFNDPETSFFTVNAGVPHGECVAAPTADPPSFYVTEPASTQLLQPDWKDHRLSLVWA